MRAPRKYLHKKTYKELTTYGSRRRINLKMCTEGPASLLIDGLISYGQQCEVQAPDSVEGAELKE